MRRQSPRRIANRERRRPADETSPVQHHARGGTSGGALCLMALSIAALSGCAGMGSAPAYLDVFDCLIPVPSGYVFNTSDSSTTHAYTVLSLQDGVSDGASRGVTTAAPEAARDARWGELNVWPYDGPVPKARYEILETRRRGPLTIEEIRPRVPRSGVDSTGSRSADSLIVVSDGRQKLSLGGNARSRVDAMVDACLASRR